MAVSKDLGLLVNMLYKEFVGLLCRISVLPFVTKKPKMMAKCRRWADWL